MIAKYHLSSQQKCYQFFSARPVRAPVLQGLKIDIFEHTFFLVALRFTSKLKQDVNISPFVNHFMLKNPRALDTFLHVNQMKMYT